MVTRLYDAARAAKHRVKATASSRADKTLSPVRRIDRVYPPIGRRVVAMTFDDGPCSKDFNNSGKGLTECVLDILKEFGAKATFDIIGSTEKNYPDVCGRVGTVFFGGRAYDHYPCFGEDSLGGAVNNEHLIKRLLEEGHELANHSFSHRIAGPKWLLYQSRKCMTSNFDVLSDLTRLHTHIVQKFGYQMKLARPPHYVDRIKGGGSVYEVYRLMGYQYLAASFDADGWKPRESYREEVEAMIAPLRAVLDRNPDALNGHIIFQKDGCNMNLRAPVLEALPIQLQLLQDYGYTVVPVSDMLVMSPIADLAPSSPGFPSVVELISRGHAVCYKNNTFHGEHVLTMEDAVLTLAGPRDWMSTDSDAIAARYRLTGVTGNELLRSADFLGIKVDEHTLRDKTHVSRIDAIQLLNSFVKKYEQDCEGSSW